MKTLREDIEAFLQAVERKRKKYGNAAYSDDDDAACAFIAIGSGTMNFMDDSERARKMRTRCGRGKPK